MQKQLQKAIDLVRKTGDRLLVLDMARPENAFAVMSLDEYEKLMIGKSEVRGLTENELVDKINRDIAVWKSEKEYSENEPFKAWQARKYLSDLKEKKQYIDNFDFADYGADCDFEEDFEDAPYFDEAFYKNQNQAERFGRKNPWAIPSDRKEAAEEIIEEDRQYLEEIK